MRWRGILMLLAASFLWGTTFVAQMAGMDELGPFSYAAARFFLGFLSLLVIWQLFRSRRERAREEGRYASGWSAGLATGLIMFVASSLQQVAMLYTTAGKTAFITCLYIVFVPIFAVFLRQRIRAENWAGAILALVGLYLLAVRGDFSLALGDGIVLVSSLFWTAHILVIDRFASEVDAIELSASQIGVCMLLSGIVALLFEEWSWQAIRHASTAIFYGGVMSAGVAFTLQILGQKYAEPAHAAILMSFEAIFGALASWLLLGELLSNREILGCVLMVAGMTVTQARHFLHRGQGTVEK